MKNKMLTLVAAAMVTVGTALPSFADGVLGGVGSFFGATTAMVVDIPEAIVVDSVYRCPKKCWKSLAYHLGDNHDQGLCWLGQQMTGITLGIPVGVVWGVPYGFIHGGRHACDAGWEKPFSMDSYIVTEEK